VDVRLRLATADDAPAIAEIYNREVTESTATFDLVPRSLAEQQAWLAARSGAYAAVVAEADGDGGAAGGVVGFGSLSPYRDRPAYSTSVEDSVYVHRDHHGQGVGRALLGELVRVATAHGFHAVFARIVEGHEASIALHQRLGFETVGVEREVGRKFGRWLDVVVMERLL
jgi:phosphinothricin acetyltransferase